jgi:hypothetical protein
MLRAHWLYAPSLDRTVGPDKTDDTADLVEQARQMGVTQHVAQHASWPGGRAIDARTMRHPGYAMSQSARPGWSASSRAQDVRRAGR